MAARDRDGIAPIQDALDRIAAIDSKEAYYAYLRRPRSMASVWRCASRSMVSVARSR